MPSRFSSVRHYNVSFIVFSVGTQVPRRYLVSNNVHVRERFLASYSGAGIGGLVLAITIGKYDSSIPIDLYEAHDSVDTAGVGITLWKQVHEVMIELGLFDDLKQIFTPLNVENGDGG